MWRLALLKIRFIHILNVYRFDHLLVVLLVFYNYLR